MKVTDLIRKLKAYGANKGAFLVLSCVYDTVDRKTGETMAGPDYIAVELDGILSKRTIELHFALLERAGVLTRPRRNANGSLVRVFPDVVSARKDSASQFPDEKRSEHGPAPEMLEEGPTDEQRAEAEREAGLAVQAGRVWRAWAQARSQAHPGLADMTANAAKAAELLRHFRAEYGGREDLPQLPIDAPWSAFGDALCEIADGAARYAPPGDKHPWTFSQFAWKTRFAGQLTRWLTEKQAPQRKAASSAPQCWVVDLSEDDGYRPQRKGDVGPSYFSPSDARSAADRERSRIRYLKEQAEERGRARA